MRPEGVVRHAGPADGFDEEDKEGMYPVSSLSIPKKKREKFCWKKNIRYPTSLSLAVYI
jgi:hypothetical protein